MNETNLINIRDRTKTEQREIAKKGGLASGESRRERKTFRRLLELSFNQKITNKHTGQILSRKSIAMIALVDRCLKGDIKALELALRIMGEYPNDTKRVEVTGRNGKDLLPPKRITRQQALDMIKEIEDSC